MLILFIYNFIVIVFKLLFYTIIFFITLLFLLKLWLNPRNSVCRCKTQLHGKVVIVTGGNSGIGLETARNLAKRGARVIIASRDNKKSEEAILDIIRTTGNTNIEYRPLDLSKFSSIREFANDINKTVDRLDILVNNAGCAGMTKRMTEDGNDIVIQINYLGPFLLTNLLLSKLKVSRPSRIVIVSSYAHCFSEFNSDDIAGLENKGYWYHYANSKLCNVLWMKALATRLPEGITVNSLHPGLVNTEIFKRLPPIPKTILLTIIKAMFKTAKQGAQTSIHLCVAPELVNATGGYYNECRPVDVHSLVHDNNLVQKVWAESVKLTEKKL